MRDVVLFFSTSRLAPEAQDTIISILVHSCVRGVAEENRLKGSTEIMQYDISRHFPSKISRRAYSLGNTVRLEGRYLLSVLVMDAPVTTSPHMPRAQARKCIRAVSPTLQCWIIHAHAFSTCVSRSYTCPAKVAWHCCRAPTGVIDHIQKWIATSTPTS